MIEFFLGCTPRGRMASTEVSDLCRLKELGHLLINEWVSIPKNIIEKQIKIFTFREVMVGYKALRQAIFHLQAFCKSLFGTLVKRPLCNFKGKGRHLPDSSQCLLGKWIVGCFKSSNDFFNRRGRKTIVN